VGQREVTEPEVESGCSLDGDVCHRSNEGDGSPKIHGSAGRRDDSARCGATPGPGGEWSVSGRPGGRCRRRWRSVKATTPGVSGRRGPGGTSSAPGGRPGRTPRVREHGTVGRRWDRRSTGVGGQRWFGFRFAARGRVPSGSASAPTSASTIPFTVGTVGVIRSIDSRRLVGWFSGELAGLPRGPRGRRGPTAARDGPWHLARVGTGAGLVWPLGAVVRVHVRDPDERVVAGVGRCRDAGDGDARDIGSGASPSVRAAKPPRFGRPTVTTVVVAWPPMRSPARLRERGWPPSAVVPPEPNVTRIVLLRIGPIPIKPADREGRF
jgi:hypothetical protein